MRLPSLPILWAGRRYAALLWLLSFLFAIRVAGQMLHVVLAGFVMTLAVYHRRRSCLGAEGRQ